MASNIVELFGYSPTDKSDAARHARAENYCPFLHGKCLKTLSSGIVSGACTLKPVRSGPVICCPYRLYASDYAALSDVADAAFGPGSTLMKGIESRQTPIFPGEKRIAVFGKRWGKELRLPNRGASGGYFVDWVLARLSESGELEEFVAVEVQSIDTTGNYQSERAAHMVEEPHPEYSTAGFNWENVNKRILPQLIYKGHVLRREKLCKSGLFFVCPEPVYTKIRERLGGKLYEYGLQSGAVTLMWYDVDENIPLDGQIRPLKFRGKFTTTVDQVALAFTSPSNLPDANVYETAIRAELLK